VPSITEKNQGLPFSERVRIAAELLETLDADRTQLTQVSDDERRRMLHATRKVAELAALIRSTRLARRRFAAEPYGNGLFDQLPFHHAVP